MDRIALKRAVPPVNDTDIEPQYERSPEVRGVGWNLHLKDYGGGNYKAVATQSIPKDAEFSGSSEAKQVVDDSATRERSARRSRQVVFDKLMMLRADRMITLTFRENITDLDQVWRYWKRLVQEVRKDTIHDFQYVVVPERQKRGAWHLHIGICGFLKVEEIRTAWYRVLGAPNAKGAETPGQVHIKFFGNERDGRVTPAIAAYLSKYITKEALQIPTRRRRYASSRGIPAPVKHTAHMECAMHWEYEKPELEELFRQCTGKNPVYTALFEVTDGLRREVMYLMTSWPKRPLKAVGTLRE